MRKNMLRALLIALIGTVFATGLVAAGGVEETDTETATETGSLVSAAGEVPIVTTPVSVTYLESYWPKGTVDESASKAYMEDVTGVNLEYVFVPRDTRVEKFQLMAQSASLPDLIGGLYSLVNANQIYSYGQQGVFLDLSDLYEEYGHWTKIAYEEIAPGAMNIMRTPDGALYSLASYNNIPSAEMLQQFYIETSFLDTVGMDMPTTTEELFAVLKAFKNQDANSNGDPNDEVPLSTAVAQWAANLDSSILMTAFTHVTATDYRAMDGRGTVVYSPATDGFRAGLQYLNRLYEAGLIYPESFTQDRATQHALNESNEGFNVIGSNPGAHRGWNNTNWSDPSEDARWRDYAMLPPIAGPDGTRTVQKHLLVGNIQLAVAVSAASDVAPVAFRLADWLMSEEGYLLMNYGVEGIGWRRAEPGELTVGGEQAYFVNLRDTYEMSEDTCTYANEEYNCLQLGQGMAQVRTDQLRNVATQSAADPLLDWSYFHNQVVDLYYPHQLDDSFYWPTYLYADESYRDEIALLQTTLDEFVKTAVVEFITGKRDAASDWDKYLDELERFGLDRYLELSQRMYDEND